MALNHTNTGADQRKSWARTPALTRTTYGPLKSEYSLIGTMAISFAVVSFKVAAVMSAMAAAIPA
ncbi:hypothetical protein V3C33_12690 [Micrococcaceae bacterium Sec5.7]